MNYYSPDQAKVIQALSSQCGTRYAQNTNDLNNPRIPTDESTDSMLRRAAAELDPQKRANLKMWASEHARTIDGDFQRALDILDDFTDEERAAVPGWRGAREVPSLQAMWVAYHGGDSPRVQAIIDRTPDRIRSSFLLRFVEMLQRNKETDYAQSMFSLARSNLDRYGDEDELRTAQNLIADCAALPDCDHAQALHEASDAINRWKPIDMKTHKEKKFTYTELNNDQRIFISEAIHEWDTDTIRANWSSINDFPVRADFRMVFLKTLVSHAVTAVTAPVKSTGK